MNLKHNSFQRKNAVMTFNKEYQGMKLKLQITDSPKSLLIQC